MTKARATRTRRPVSHPVTPPRTVADWQRGWQRTRKKLARAGAQVR